MAGHSKWANIKFRKAAQDAKRGKLFTKLIKEITVAARMGGGDPDANPRLRSAVDKALSSNMTRDTVNRAISRGAGGLDGVNYEELRYEGYASSGVAVLVECTTDNRNRTVSEVRHAFSKYGGNLGTDGSVAYLFTRLGSICFAAGVDEDLVMDVAIEAGADDVQAEDDGSVEVVTSADDFHIILTALKKAGLQSESAEIEQRASVDVELDTEDAEKVLRFLDALDDLDDVQNVYTNAAFPDDMA
ncbi:MAG TPA: YebC/PmpR family DNA-binding transcriptional regulator [Gammaproteobacteria bacterium]|nr:YebC/PmpR family DNA-binding transcriptional regulator [Gammaproteobacteria bacterium]